MASPQARRRQRSTRLTVAVVLLAVAALVVTGAVLSDSWPLVTGAAVLSVLLGASATRITHSELLHTRRDASRNRAQLAQEYRDLTVERTTEHAEYTAAMQSRLDRQEHALSELEGALASAQKRAAEATRRRNAEARRAEVAEQQGRGMVVRLMEAEERAAQANLRVTELEQELHTVRAELDSWQVMQEARKRA